jgi:hypothetical protein
LIVFFVSNVRVCLANFLVFFLTLTWFYLNESNSLLLSFCVWSAVNTFSIYSLIVSTTIQHRRNVAIVFEDINHAFRWKNFRINKNYQLIYCFKFQFRFDARFNDFWTRQLQYLDRLFRISLESIFLLNNIKSILLDFLYESDVVVRLERSITWRDLMHWWLLSVRLLRLMSWFDETRICKFCLRREKIICRKTRCNFFYDNVVFSSFVFLYLYDNQVKISSFLSSH